MSRRRASGGAHGGSPGAGRGTARPGASSGRALDLLIVFFLAIAIAFTYASVRNHGFVNLDDPEYVYENPRVTAGLTAEGFTWAFTAVHSANWHPLTWLSHMLDCQLYGLQPGGHHVTNALLHALASLCLFGALRAMTGARWPSALVAALFALHPRNVESVAWISERKDVLSALFWCAAMWAYALYVRRPASGRYIAVLALFALGLLAKPMVVTFPFALLLLDAWPLGRTALCGPADPAGARVPKRTLGALALEKAPLFALSAIVAVVTYEAQRRSGAVTTFADLPFSVRVPNAIVAYATYLLKTVWPAGLAAFYPYRIPVPAGETILSLLALLALSAGAIATARTRPYLLIGWLWYLGTLVPVIGFIRAGEQAMADRFTYIPLIGPFAAVAFAAADAAARAPIFRRVLTAVAAAALLALALASRAQVEVWRDSIALFEHARAVTRNNHLAELNLSAALAERGRPGDALAHADEAARMRPADARVHVNRGVALAAIGDRDAARRAYADALAVEPDNALALLNLALLLAEEERWEESAEAYARLLRVRPDHAKAHAGLGFVRARQGRHAEAIAAFERALVLNAYLSVAANGLALSLEQSGRRDEAIAVLGSAVARDPEEARLRYNLAATLSAAGRSREARAALDDLLRLAPDDVEARVALAEILAGEGRRAEASAALETAAAAARASGQAARAGEIEARRKQLDSSAPAPAS